MASACDVGMLVGLDDYVKQQANRIPLTGHLIALHQMGNHGPAYF